MIIWDSRIVKVYPSMEPRASIHAESSCLLHCCNQRLEASPCSARIRRILPRQRRRKQLPALPERNSTVARLSVAEAGVHAVVRGARAVGTRRALHRQIADAQVGVGGAVTLEHT